MTTGAILSFEFSGNAYCAATGYNEPLPITALAIRYTYNNCEGSCCYYLGGDNSDSRFKKTTFKADSFELPSCVKTVKVFTILRGNTFANELVEKRLHVVSRPLEAGNKYLLTIRNEESPRAVCDWDVRIPNVDKLTTSELQTLAQKADIRLKDAEKALYTEHFSKAQREYDYLLEELRKRSI